MAINLIPKRKIEDLFPENTKTQSITTFTKTIHDETTNQVDVRNIGKFDYRLRIPVGTDKYD